ncbi:MAG: dihydrodipicolinate synthase family protein [Planctomycetaceae bacterium]|nr:dihydrodipicolinate synthase family protein [Planctomycetaceae bacterium]
MSKYRLIAAVHTPFDAEGEFHSVAVERQVELLLEQNVAGVFPGGTTGESLSLSLGERLALGKQWVDVASGTDLEVILHVGANALPDAVTLAEQAGQIGASGIAAMPPTYFRPDGIDMILADLKRLSAAAPELLLYYYDIPSMTGVAVDTVELVERASEEIPQFGGIKFSRPDLPVLQRVLNSPKFSGEVFFGSDEMFLSAWMFGVRGAVGSTYNFMAPVYHRMLDAFEAGNLEDARQLQLQSAKLVAALIPFGFLSASKLLMRYLGADCGQVRSPLRALDERRSRELFEVLEPFADLFPRKLEYVSADAVATSR